MAEPNTLLERIPKDLRECESGYIHVFDGFEAEGDVWIKSACSRPWCRQCEPIRVWRLQRKIMKYLDWHSAGYKHLWIVTRSVRNESTLESSFNTLRAAQVAFAKQSVREKSHPLRVAAVWIATTEITFSHRTGWNVHEHMIWGTQSSRMDFGKFHETWDRAAGFGGAHINIVKLDNSRHAANYVAKYLSKGVWGGLSSGRAYLVRDALKGRNRIQSKRGTVPPKDQGPNVFCCVASTANACNGSAEIPQDHVKAFYAERSEASK